MTDEHGSDQQPVHEEVPEQEHPAQTPEAGVWSDDHPPVDDFADAGAVNEETASVSQEATGEGDEAAMQSTAPSRSMLPLFAGIGGILLLGAVIYWQFGHSSPPPMMTIAPAAPKSSSSLVNANSKTPAPAAPAPSTKKVEEADIASLYKPPADSVAAITTAETAPTTAMAATPEPTAPPAPAMPAAPAPPTTQPVAVPAPAVPDAMAARIETLEKLVQADTQELNQLNNMVAANQAMPPVANQMSPALEDRLNKIEQTLMQIEHKAEAKTPAVTMPAEANDTSEASSEVVAKSAVHRTHTAKHKHSAKKAKTTPHHTVPLAPMPMANAPSSSWFLRAATPSEAWVSSDPHTAELRHVQVGDTLPGIGQIHSIRQTPAGWEIDGATGTVR